MRDPAQRLGGLEELKKQAFFKDVDFDQILSKKVPPPFKPEISGKLDIRNFDEEFTSENIQMTQLSDTAMNLIKKNQEKFGDFNN